MMENYDNMQKYVQKIETCLMTSKLQWAEDQNYFKEEVKRFENKMKELNEEIKRLSSEKNYFQMKFKQIEEQNGKKRKISEDKKYYKKFSIIK